MLPAPRVPNPLRDEFLFSQEPEPHRIRRRRILASHPEVRILQGPARSSALVIAGLVVLQLGMAVGLRHAPWWVLLPAAYLLGSVLNHALFVMIHECTHNLVWKGSRGNRILAILANVPIVFPGAMPFRKYHLMHHKYQGVPGYDPDLPGPMEARLVGNSPFRKGLWLLFFFLVEGLRPVQLKEVKHLDAWTVGNGLVMALVSILIVRTTGWEALLYLTLSTVFGVGLHPVGARWIQEHFVMRSGQETYSYYGPWNRFAFNVGYHNEHHDMVTISWSRLPRLHAIAPEFYDDLYAHRSWTGLLIHFIRDHRISLYSRTLRSRDDLKGGELA